MSQLKKSKNTTSSIQKKFPLLLGIGIGIILLVIAGYLIFPDSAGNSLEKTSQNNGAPSLQVDKEVIDFGEVSFNNMVTASFNLTNTGDSLLEFKEAPYIELKEGC